MEKILIVEDNRGVNDLLAEALKNEGYELTSEYDGLTGLKAALSNKYDLLLLDIMLPFKGGDEIIKEVRKFNSIPIIVISAKDVVSTKIEILKLGADDYVTKPFDLGEVAARVESQLRRVKKQGNISEMLKYKDLVINLSKKEVSINNNTIDVTAKEYMILELLLKNREKVFSKANIYEAIWNEEYLGDDNAVKTHMSNLRSKLKKAGNSENYIETVWGLGYRLVKE